MIWRWGIFVWIAAAMAASLLWAPLVPVLQETTRVLYFHIPAAWLTVLALGWSMVQSVLYLWKRDLRHDDHAAAAAELGVLFCIAATVSGSLWAKSMWGSYWNWDPRETSIFFLLLIYGAYRRCAAASTGTRSAPGSRRSTRSPRSWPCRRSSSSCRACTRRCIPTRSSTRPARWTWIP
jgi:ABC-type transport system involved in cytochrome c biogenesis permease subunit